MSIDNRFFNPNRVEEYSRKKPGGRFKTTNSHLPKDESRGRN